MLHAVTRMCWLNFEYFLRFIDWSSVVGIRLSVVSRRDLVVGNGMFRPNFVNFLQLFNLLSNSDAQALSISFLNYLLSNSIAVQRRSRFCSAACLIVLKRSGLFSVAHANHFLFIFEKNKRHEKTIRHFIDILLYYLNFCTILAMG